MFIKNKFVAAVLSIAVIVPASTFGNTGAIAATQTNGDWVMPNGHLNITVEDLKFMLDQIKIGEAVATRTATNSTTIANANGTSIVYPFDMTSTTRCLQARDIISAGTNTFGATGLSNVYPYSNLESYGTRTVDGSCNNITNVGTASATTGTYKPVVAATDTAGWGAADELFIRTAKRAVSANYTATTTAGGTSALTPTQTIYSDPSSYIVDPTPRRISNLISDQSTNNPAAVEAATQAQITLYQNPNPVSENSVNATTGAVSKVLQIPNITPDYNVSAGYNSWFTLFGQFFDHGLDLIPKAGSSAYIPLDQSDPVYTPGAPNYMVLTRGAIGTGTNAGESYNTTTPYVDQSQTYGSHASQNFFLREYSFPATGPVATGRLIEGSDGPHTAINDATSTLMPNTWLTAGGLVDTTLHGTITNPTGAAVDPLTNGGLAQWRDIKAQARLLGIQLTDFDANSIPIIATDQYGNFVPNPLNGATKGYPMMLMRNVGGTYDWQSGTPTNPLATTSGGWTAVSSGHAFINDTMANAVPFAGAIPDADSVMNSPLAAPDGVHYDNESLDAHYVSGDGRSNENIGLSAIHTVFHSEHNTVASDIENMLNAGAAAGLDPAFVAEWKTGGNFNGSRIYQAARIVNENEYQHMVYDEFIRRIVPSLPLFAAYDPNANASISQEFASAVYRVGHSMLNETIARSNPGTFYDPANNQDVSLITGFTNPPQARLQRPMTVASATYSAGAATYTMAAGETPPKATSIVSIQGMADPAYNLTSAVVDSSTSNTFTVSTQFAGNSATAVAIAALAGSSASQKVSNTDATPIATVSVSDPGTNNFDYTPLESAASIAQGMSSQRGNEVDEFTTDGVRNNLLGLPLDLASLNMTRGRDVQLPTLNQFRAQNSAALKPYLSWVDFIAHMRYPESAVNFIAAYGTHPSLQAINIGTVTSADSTTTPGTVTYTATSTSAIKVGDTVTISGLATGNIANGVVASVIDATHFSINQKRPHGVLDAKSFTPAQKVAGDVATFRANTPVAIAPADLTAGTPTTGSVTRVPTVTEVRELARDLVAKGMDTNITGAIVNTGSITYTSPNNYSVGQTVTVTNVVGLAGTNCFNATGVVTAAVASEFTMTVAGASAATCALYSKLGSSTYVSGGTGLATKAEATDFMNSTYLGAGPTNWATTETGLNNVDLWTGGLAENPVKQPITPPMFGPVFQLVFADQALRLQNGDRFYYLGRLAGTNLGEEIPAQKFTDIVRRNTPSASDTRTVASATGVLGMVSPGFSISDCAFTGNTRTNPGAAFTGKMFLPTTETCGAGTMSTISNVWTHAGLDNVVGFGDPNSTAGTAIAGGAGDDNIFGTAGNDVLSGGVSGGDLIDGYAGDDILLGGPGEDLLKGGSGNDVINVGDSALGDVADGGSGNDFMHTGQSKYATASMIGESGNDFIQASNGSDIAIFGSEGNDWLEGLADIDTIFGDSGLAGALPIIKGGDDVITGGAGNDILSGDGGNDIFQLGDGVDLANGGTGFDWATYEFNKRFDTGPGLPSMFTDQGGLNPNTAPGLAGGDGLADIEGISGSTGNDVIYGSQSANIVVPNGTAAGVAGIGQISGAAGSNIATVTGNNLKIAAGMTAVGTGVGIHATVVGSGPVTNAATGVTNTQVTFSVENSAAITGPVSFAMWPLDNPGTITGLTNLLNPIAGVGGTNTPTPGWNNAAGGSWTGGNIIFGGAGSDLIGLNAGSNVVDGDRSLHTCIQVTHNATAFTTNADVTCGAGMGYSTMSLLSNFMDTGILTPTDLTVVKEIVNTAPLVAPNTAGNIDTLELPGTSAQYAFAAIPALSLPTGVTTGFRITGPGGTIDTIYDMEQVVFGGVTPTRNVDGSYAGGVAIANNALAGLVVTATGGVLTPAFDPNVLNYTFTIPQTPTTAAATFTATPGLLGGVRVNGGTQAAQNTAVTANITVSAGLAVPIVVTGSNGATITYTVTTKFAPTIPTFTAPVATANGFTSDLTNYSASYAYVVTSTNPNAIVILGTSGLVSTTRTLTVTGLAPGEAAHIDVVASQRNYVAATATVDGTAISGTFTNTPDPTMSGQLFVGSTLTANQTAWTPSATFGYSWKCTAGGLTNEIATSASYVLQAADAGCLISLDVTGSKTGFAPVTRSVSNPTVVLNHFTTVPVPTIIGDGTVGSYLTVLDGVWSANAIYQHQWYRNGLPIAGAVGPIYTITDSDLGTLIQVQVTVSRPNFVTDTAISASKFISLPPPVVVPVVKAAAVVPTFKSSSVMTRGKTFKVVLARGGRNSQGLSTTVTASGACKATAIKQSFRGYRVKQVVGYTIKMTKKGTCVTKVSVAGSSSVNAGTRITSIRVK